MFSAFTNSFKIPELRQRILFTLALLVVVRVGAAIPCPGVNTQVLGEFFSKIVDQQSQGSVIGMFNLFSGGALENCALFSLGVMPYISASIMMQLMTAVIPSLAKLAREEGGRQKVTQYSRVLTLILCLVQGYLLALGFEKPESIPFLSGIGSVVAQLGMPLVADPGWGFRIMTVISLTTGTMILMWLGEQITEKGIGNGVSLIITVGILARFPAALVNGWQKLISGGSPLLVILLLLFLLVVIAGTIAMTQAVRKIIVQYAKQVRGNKVYGGQSSFLPLKVNYAGVMPIIFAQAILLFPAVLMGFVSKSQWVASIAQSLASGWLHYTFTVLMILFFSYFWVATQFNPVQIADDLKKHGGFIPGVRPGQPTADFLDFTMTRLTLAGATFLAVLAVLPMIIQYWLRVPALTAQFFGGTSLLIMVGVVLDTMRQTETYLLQRHYDGFLKRGKVKGRSATASSSQGNGASSDAVIWLWTGIAVVVVAGIAIFLSHHAR
ncbi:protein translocase subunit secY/sec61 alpha [Verrucomicrobium sp. GAS474]|uniref:preprotein translocase subunit SecY n=1 Tax=Verrucomicrobium sp. GAS474 TaxID=1882831 RepID=UPI00087C31DA|nr:preprotein translocase subunit SecY [Verrucomicrobium sp. GAS474]SDU25842.1 protein translocase subunit secY/sec61 alpha [Verrucomicrobium sp. GAS474]